MIAAITIDLDIDLSQFSQYLQQVGIPHRISEEGVNQILWVNSPSRVTQVLDLFEHYKSGTLLTLPTVTRVSQFHTGQLIRRFPLTLGLITINILLFPVSMGLSDAEVTELFKLMTFVSFDLRGDLVYFTDLEHTLDTHQYWRLLTPMFLHFGWLHVVFNLLWIWEVGRRIEVVNNAYVLLLVTLVSSLLANLLQYYLAGASLFGGMSGVVFGYIGYSLVWSRLVPTKSMGLAPGLYIFMFVYLALGFTGAIDLLGLGSLANGAHLGGLIGGLLIGTVAGLLFRPSPATD
jgi:GlpG protein